MMKINFLVVFTLTLRLVQVSFPLTCFQKHVFWHKNAFDASNIVQCNGVCRLMMDERLKEEWTLPDTTLTSVLQDCVEGLSSAEVGCRNETRSKSMVCFCKEDYCNSPRNISKSTIMKQVLYDLVCYKGDLDSVIKNTALGPYCLATIRRDITTNRIDYADAGSFSQGLYHTGSMVLFTKYELMFRHWPYGNKSGPACTVMEKVESGETKRDTFCVCKASYCNVPSVLRVPKPSKTVQCYLGIEAEKVNTTDICMAGDKCSCWGEYCLLQYNKPLGHSKNYKQKGCLNSSVEQPIGIIETLGYYRKICKEDFCNEDSGASKKILSKSSILASITYGCLLQWFFRIV